MPNVNTILIDRADRFGLSDLYQLRGRVGRYKHKAYAYLLLPDYDLLMDAARKRIRALEQYSTLGSGFKLALKDLEIRGAGNILGAEQSGHIVAIGFDLYSQFLKRTIAVMQGRKPAPLINVEIKIDFLDLAPGGGNDAAVLPYDYIEDETLRLTLYRKVSSAATEKEVRELARELQDRFGPMPKPVKRLLKVMRIRILAATHHINEIETRGEKLMLMRHGDYIKQQGQFPRLRSSGADAKLSEMIRVLRKIK